MKARGEVAPRGERRDRLGRLLLEPDQRVGRSCSGHVRRLPLVPQLSTHAMARSQLVQRTERTALTLERIERRLAELPAAISTADAAPDAFCLRDEGFGTYVLEPARAGVGCTAGAATAATQTVAALAIN